MINDRGIVYDDEYGPMTCRPGAILALMVELRKRCGVLKAVEKDGVRFKVRSADTLVDRLRGICNDLGILIYPVQSVGKGEVIEGNKPGSHGTMAEVQVRIRIQAVEDASYIDVAGYGQGADSQDKAGGKAGTYAFKQALVQALLAGGMEDTDDQGEPIKGGVRKAPKVRVPTLDEVTAHFKASTTMAQWEMALKLAKEMKPEDQLAIGDIARTTKNALGAGK